MTTVAPRQDEINNAGRILGLRGPITSYAPVRKAFSQKAFSQKVHEADDGKGEFKGDMHAFRRAKETLFAALSEKGMSEEEKRREEALRQKAEEERLSWIREQAKQEENQQHRAPEQKEDAQESGDAECFEDSQEEDEIQKAAKLIEEQARRRAEEAERAEQIRIKAAIQIEEQLLCIAHSIHEIRAALDAIMS